MVLELVDPYTPEAEAVWRTLEDSAPRSFFTSWGWIENWLATVPRDAGPRMAIVREDGPPIAAFCVTRREVARVPMLPSRALYLNTTGDVRLDKLWIEHNGMVGRELSVGRLVDLLGDDWDELFLPGLRPDAFGGLVETVVRGFRVRIEREVPTYVVDLARVREQGYLALLGSQTRAQVRRAQREAGELSVEIAADVDGALAIYRELVALHQAAWRAKGQPGAFADPWFDAFHRRLITHRFRHGEIELVRMTSAKGVVGALYNYLYRGRVYQYQSGLAQFAEPRMKPGFVLHAAAIEHAAAAGHDVYDFLAGDVRYKQSLSTDKTTMVWARVQRQRLRFLLEDQLRLLSKRPLIARVRAAVAPAHATR